MCRQSSCCGSPTAVANLIREGRTAQIVNALQAGGDDGMLVLERHLAELVRAKRIRRETALGGGERCVGAERVPAGGRVTGCVDWLIC